MSQVTHPGFSLRGAVQSRRAIMLAGLLALVATAVVVLVLAIGGSSSHTGATPVTPSAHQGPNVRYDGGPEEGSSNEPGPNARYDGGPEEGSSNAASSGPQIRHDGGPEESSVAASISGR